MSEQEDRTIPMFPLGSVLLPTSVLPLHIFEPRYRAFAQDVMAGDREFGVTLIERGFEVGGDDVRTVVGCMAQVLEAEEFDDGRWALVCVGTRRIEVTQWLPDDPYPRARVRDIPDTPSTPADIPTYGEATKLLRQIMDLRQQLAMPTLEVPDIAQDPALGSYQVAALAPFGPFDRQRVLSTGEPAARLALLIQLLVDQLEDLDAQQRLQ